MISVIVPIYNSEKYLDQCLASIVNQKYYDLEIILVNDGSTDSSGEICERYNESDNRVVLINKQNEGLVRARKDGVRRATGEYITFVDADDWIDVDTYVNLGDFKEDIVAYGLMEEYGYVSKAKTNYFADGYYDEHKIKECIIPEMLCTDNFFEFGMLPNLVCKLIKRSLFLKMMDEVSEDVTIGEDVDFFYRIVSEAKSLSIKSNCPYHYRQHFESMMKKDIPIEAIKKLYLDLLMIKGLKEEKEWGVQLKKYIIFIMLLKRTDKAIDLIKEIKDIDGEVVIYGAGAFGEKMYDKLKTNKKIEELYIVDKEWKNLNQKLFLVGNPETIVDINPDKIIISILNEKVCSNAREYLIEMGVDNNKIIKINFSDLYMTEVFDM